MNDIELAVGARPWVRDFTLVGCLTGFLAPFVVLRDWSYAATTCIGGLASGAMLGLFSAWFFAGRARRLPKLAFVPLGLLLGAVWGVAAAMATVCTPARQLLPLSIVFGGAAGAVQLGWFWLAYGYRRVNRRSTWPVVLVASLISGCLGFTGFAVAFF